MNEKAWQIIGKSGPWAMLAFVLIAFILFELRPAIAAIQSQHLTLNAALAEQRAEDGQDFKLMRDVLNEILDANQRTAYLQRVTCQNQARTPSELRACAKDRD
jgi:hypothetical protein